MFTSTEPRLKQTDSSSVVYILTLNCVILDIFIGHGGCHGQSVTPDTGSDVRDAEGQSAPVLLVNESRHGAGFRILVSCSMSKRKEG